MKPYIYGTKTFYIYKNYKNKTHKYCNSKLIRKRRMCHIIEKSSVWSTWTICKNTLFKITLWEKGIE